jgi:predicted transposase/invertase (TIGR01784 family)
MPRRLISFDWAIKRILRSKANFDILEGFLSELLKEDVKVLEILESESNQDRFEDKSNRLDLKVKDTKGEIILIEIQYEREMDYLQRVLYASSKAITEHIASGDSYGAVSKIISISILYFDFGHGDDYVYKGTTQFIGIHNHSLLELNEKQKELYKVEKVENIFPEFYLIKVNKFNDHAKDSLDEWINFLKNETIPENPKAKGLQKAKKELDYLKMSDDERKQYERYMTFLRDQASAYESTYIVGHLEGKREGIQEGIQKGIQEGINKRNRELAKSLLDVLDIETIALKTGLSLEEIEELKKIK